MFDSIIRDDSTRYAKGMNNNNNKEAQSLRELAADLGEIHDVMNELCEQLQGGGIISARDIEPSLAKAVPQLRRAVTTLQSASDRRDDDGPLGEVTAPGQSPLLM